MRSGQRSVAGRLGDEQHHHRQQRRRLARPRQQQRRGSGGRPVSATKDFLSTADLTQAPTVSVNQMAAVTNLFYLNNVIHDKLYRHGFTSDTLALYINRNDVVGEYSYNAPGGIRRFPYTNYPNTYSDVTGSSVHADGEIYAATMWKLLQLWEAAGYTQDQLFDHVVDGMNYTPAQPAYEDMRDGILAAVPTQAQDCVVWNAFAQFGIGQGADGAVTCFLGIFCSPPTITESFAKPAVCP